jgi:superfamily I DNA/RNA helicase
MLNMADLPQAVLESKADKICVVAAPGSGKTTRIIIPKAQQFLADTTIDPDEVLLLTFSRLSALDLKARVKTLERAPRASTVHSFCLKFLLSEDTHEIRSRVECILLEFEKDSLLSDLKLIFAGRASIRLARYCDLEIAKLVCASSNPTSTRPI